MAPTWAGPGLFLLVQTEQNTTDTQFWIILPLLTKSIHIKKVIPCYD